MITQILGVALISLLTITPTIQQNNIEQLIAPNIEIQPMAFNSPDSNRLWVVNQFSYYNDTSSLFNYNANALNINFTEFETSGVNITYNTTSNLTSLTYITDTDFYITKSFDRSITGSFLQSLIQDYYIKTKGSITSTSFSFSNTGDNLSTTTSYYTYSVFGTGGTVSGRFYYVSNSNVSPHNHTKNSTVTIPTNANINELFNQLNINNTWAYSDNRFNQKILYYFLDSNMPTTVGSHTRTIHGRDNYGYIRSFGSITINMIAADTTLPTITSITGNPVNWTNQNVVLTVQATDNVSLNNTAFSFDNGINWLNSNISTQFTTNQFVNIKVRDSSNNETSQQVIINRIDKQSPSINLSGNWKNTFELGELTSNQSLLNYLSISDGASGINSSLTTISNFNYNQAGTYTNVQISATDNAGNTFIYTAPTITITQPVDTTPPTISGLTSIIRQQGNITTQDILSNFTISDPSGIEESRIQTLDNTIVTSWNDFTTGTYQLRVYARDTVGNIALYQFELIVTAPPIPDTTPPVITGSLLTSFVIGTYTSTSEILALYTITDNVAVGVSQVLGTINFEQLGDYPVTISATDTSNNTTTLNIVVRIRADVVLGNYNPLTDLLSGIFGGALSMIFTIGTINVLGLRLLDAMGVIILGAVLLFVYKAIKGGS
jgi:hypothetical protein